MGLGEWVKEKNQRARQKSFAQLSRSVFLRLWPFSLFIRVYYRIRFWPPIWHGVINRHARAVFQSYRQESILNAIQQKAISELRKFGIFVTTIEDLLVDPSILGKLQSEAFGIFRKEEIQKQFKIGKSVGISGKYYVIRAFEGMPELSLSNGFLKFSLDEKILAIVNEYFEMCCHLNGFDLWCNLPVQESAPEMSSQRWHRDYDDKMLVKVFIYLVDVDEEMGPFSYLRETHLGGKYNLLFPSNPPEGSCPPLDEVECAIPTEQMKTCVGKAGTVIFCDTTGLHKGGRSTTFPRILFTATYATQGAIETSRYRLSKKEAYDSLPPQAKFAIGLFS